MTPETAPTSYGEMDLIDNLGQVCKRIARMQNIRTARMVY